MPIVEVHTKPYTDQKLGTSGLRKKVTVFQQENYLANFVQSTFNALKSYCGIPEVLIIGGDGRYFLEEAVQIILKVAAANGVKRAWVGRCGLLSTPAVSAVMRRREGGFRAKGAFILTASHNLGGPTEDFGIKYNAENGGPASEKLTSIIYEETLRLNRILSKNDIPNVDISVTGAHTYDDFTVEVIDSIEDYVKYMSEVFDFNAIRQFLARKDFSMHIDCMHGAGGPYARAIYHDCLGVPAASLHKDNVLPDFGGGHPDPNLTYAHDLVSVMGLLADGSVNSAMADAKVFHVPNFGAAFDGDVDRNMILGDRFFVNPSDSLAVLAANADVVPFFKSQGGLKSVARSMPTSGAVDRVAAEKKLQFFEVPTGWKFFGNLMDSKSTFNGPDYNPLMCGEESFGTGSSHIREKDGVWASLFWLSVLAARNPDPSKPLVTVQNVVEDHWEKYGRNYYSRYDYEGVTTEAANLVMKIVTSKKPEDIPLLSGKRCCTVDSFEYHDPVDGSVSSNQGVRVLFEDGSRFVLRLSGTGSSGATIRLYLEQYMEPAATREHLTKGTLPATSVALHELIDLALSVSAMAATTGRNAPTVVT